jgi:translation initiation factor 2 beta subunit (eIF-2beta)/eIF-5
MKGSVEIFIWNNTTQHINGAIGLQNWGSNLSLDEIEAFYGSLKNCPKCNSDEGFWLTANRSRSYVQCKHCGAILEIIEAFEGSGKDKTIFRKLKR